MLLSCSLCMGAQQELRICLLTDFLNIFLAYWGLPLGLYFVLAQLERIHHDSLIWQ